ncbi:MAG: hypothetical protein RH859_01000 [Longimicrobiales bacterium]
MPIDLIWWPDEPAVEFACAGPVTGLDLVRANRDVIADPRATTLRWQLADMEAVTEFEINRSHIEQIVMYDTQLARLAPDLERVAIACREDLIYGFARMYELTLAGQDPAWETGVFRTRGQALEWLGVADRGAV